MRMGKREEEVRVWDRVDTGQCSKRERKGREDNYDDTRGQKNETPRGHTKREKVKITENVITRTDKIMTEQAGSKG